MRRSGPHPKQRAARQKGTFRVCKMVWAVENRSEGMCIACGREPPGKGTRVVAT